MDSTKMVGTEGLSCVVSKPKSQKSKAKVSESEKAFGLAAEFRSYPFDQDHFDRQSQLARLKVWKQLVKCNTPIALTLAKQIIIDIDCYQYDLHLITYFRKEVSGKRKADDLIQIILETKCDSFVMGASGKLSFMALPETSPIYDDWLPRRFSHDANLQDIGRCTRRFFYKLLGSGKKREVSERIKLPPFPEVSPRGF